MLHWPFINAAFEMKKNRTERQCNFVRLFPIIWTVWWQVSLANVADAVQNLCPHLVMTHLQQLAWTTCSNVRAKSIQDARECHFVVCSCSHTLVHIATYKCVSIHFDVPSMHCIKNLYFPLFCSCSTCFCPSKIILVDVCPKLHTQIIPHKIRMWVLQ